jgi:beta-lactamase class A
MLSKRVPLYAAAVGWVVAGLGTWLIVSAGKDRPSAPTENKAVANTCDPIVKRTQGYAHVSPLLSVEQVCGSPRMGKLKHDVAGAIDQAIAQGVLTRASVYVSHTRSSDWFSLNPNERYNPGSLLKIPTMMTILKMAEGDDELLATRWRFERVPPMPAAAFPPSRAIVPGRAYTVQELLEYTILVSDNLSNAVLLQHIDNSRVEDLMTRLGLPKVDRRMPGYSLTPEEYAAILKALYNVAYLSPESSEYAMDLLLNTEFSAGLRKGVPNGVEMAHKFGEWKLPGAGQFHEAGIVYGENGPYIIVVMTEGPDVLALPEVVAGVSSMVYQVMSGARTSI